MQHKQQPSSSPKGIILEPHLFSSLSRLSASLFSRISLSLTWSSSRDCGGCEVHQVQSIWMSRNFCLGENSTSAVIFAPLQAGSTAGRRRPHQSLLSHLNLHHPHSLAALWKHGQQVFLQGGVLGRQRGVLDAASPGIGVCGLLCISRRCVLAQNLNPRQTKQPTRDWQTTKTHRLAYLRVFAVSSKSASHELMQLINTVKLLPPRLSCSSRVSFESL